MDKLTTSYTYGGRDWILTEDEGDALHFSIMVRNKGGKFYKIPYTSIGPAEQSRALREWTRAGRARAKATKSAARAARVSR